MVWGWQKLDQGSSISEFGLAGYSTHFLKNPMFKIPRKSSKILTFISQSPYRTPYRQNPVKSMLSAILSSKNQISTSLKFYYKFHFILINRCFYRYYFFHLKNSKLLIFLSLYSHHHRAYIKLYTN